MQLDFLLLRGDQSHSRSAYREIRVGLKEAELLFQFTRAPTVIRVEARDQREPRCHEAAIERMSKPLISFRPQHANFAMCFIHKIQISDWCGAAVINEDHLVLCWEGLDGNGIQRSAQEPDFLHSRLLEVDGKQD